MPAGVTTNIQLDQLSRRVHVSYFRGIFMRNALPISGAHRNERYLKPGCERFWRSHWVAYAKRDNHVIYFDSFGNLRPKELMRYFGNGVTKIKYNRIGYILSNLQPKHLWTNASAISSNGRCVPI